MKQIDYKDIVYKSIITLSALLIALFLGGLIFVAVGANPLKAYYVMFTEPLNNLYGLTEMLIRSAPLMLVALGIAVSFRSGILNIGGEGQILMGAICGTAFGLYFPHLPRIILIPAVFLVSFLGGAIWAGIAGYLKAYLEVNEILSTVMLNYIAIQIFTFLIRGPLIDKKEIINGTGVPQTALLDKNVWLHQLIKGTRLHTGIFIAIIIAICIYFFLWKTTTGYKFRAVGAQAKAANYAGINVKRYLMLAIVISGGLSGMAGAMEVIGVHHKAMDGISSGYGFSGIVVALFGGLHPLGIIPASVLFGLLILGADMMQRAVQVPSAIVLAIQGLIILAIVSTRIFFVNRKIKSKIMDVIFFRKDKKEETEKTEETELKTKEVIIDDN